MTWPFYFGSHADRESCPALHSAKNPNATSWQLGSDEELGILLQADGVEKYRLRCRTCHTESGDIPKHQVERWPHLTVKWRRENEKRIYPPCSYRPCDKPGVDLHHFAPRNTFGDQEADNWPTSPLCKEHHAQWHLTMDGYRWNAKRIDSTSTEEQEANSDMDPRSFIMGNGCPGFSFVRPGDRIVGQIISEPKLQQMKVWRSGKPTDELAVWPSGDPKLQLAFQVQTQFRNYEGIREPKRESPDDGRRTVYVNGKHREAALKNAIRSAGAEWLEVGGWYDETYTGDDYESTAGIKPKLAEIRYAPPSAAFRAQQAQAQPEPVYAAQAQVNAERQVAQQGQPVGQPNWQQAGWHPQAAHHAAAQQARVQEFSQAVVPSHHGSPADMPTWATSNAPVSTPPVQSAPPAQAAQPMSTLEQLRAARQSAEFTEEPPF